MYTFWRNAEQWEREIDIRELQLYVSPQSLTILNAQCQDFFIEIEHQAHVHNPVSVFGMLTCNHGYDMYVYGVVLRQCRLGRFPPSAHRLASNFSNNSEDRLHYSTASVPTSASSREQNRGWTKPNTRKRLVVLTITTIQYYYSSILLIIINHTFWRWNKGAGRVYPDMFMCGQTFNQRF